MNTQRATNKNMPTANFFEIDFSKKTVDENPFSTKLKADIKKRNLDVVLQFYPKVDDANCDCGVGNSFKLLISHYVPQKTSNKMNFQNEFSSLAGNLLTQIPVKVFLCQILPICKIELFCYSFYFHFRLR